MTFVRALHSISTLREYYTEEDNLPIPLDTEFYAAGIELDKIDGIATEAPEGLVEAWEQSKLDPVFLIPAGKSGRWKVLDGAKRLRAAKNHGLEVNLAFIPVPTE
jgi:hypothetical protein